MSLNWCRSNVIFSIMYLFLSRSFDLIVRPWTVISMDSKQPWALCVAYRLLLIGCSISSMSCLLLVFACMNRCDMHCAVFPMLDLEDLFSISYNLRIFLIYWIFYKIQNWKVDFYIFIWFVWDLWTLSCLEK